MREAQIFGEEEAANRACFKEKVAFMLFNAVRRCIHFTARISLCARQNLLPPLSFPTTPVLVSAPRKHAAVAVPLTAKRSLLPKKHKQMLERRQGRAVAIQEKHLIYIWTGFECPRLQQHCCTNILLSGLSDAQAGRRCSETTHTPPLQDL